MVISYWDHLLEFLSLSDIPGGLSKTAYTKLSARCRFGFIGHTITAVPLELGAIVGNFNISRPRHRVSILNVRGNLGRSLRADWIWAGPRERSDLESDTVDVRRDQSVERNDIRMAATVH